MSKRHLVTLVVLALAVGAVSKVKNVRAQNDRVLSLRELAPVDHKSETFVLTGEQALRITAVAAEPERRRGDDDWRWENEERETWPAAAWIIDARTREVVWDIRTARTDRDRSGVRRFDGTVRLPAGIYEAHYASYVATATHYSGNFNVASLVRGIRGRDRRDARYGGHYVDNGDYRDFELTIRGEGRVALPREIADAALAREQTLLRRLVPGTMGRTERFAFELTRATDVEVLGLGEMNRGGDHDYGWIQEADSRNRVWEMRYRRSQPAGGAHKNRMQREVLRLNPGRYVAYYVTDGSHDPQEWNAVPPFDPQAYGLTLRVADAGSRAAVREIQWEPVPAGQTIVSLIGVGDDELRSEGFTLRRPMGVRVYAIGEGDENEMYDYAWIVDVASRRRVWTMRYDDTEDAGGAGKNRLFDGLIRLEPGSYMVYYKSDGSHSAGDRWNDGAPAEPRYWGVSIFPADGTLERGAIAPYERPASSALAELARMRNGVRARTAFTLSSESAVRVVSVGEGISGAMYDYGIIENAETGRVVWEMTYRATEHAGGADKNRIFDGVIRLPAGRYTLRFQTDGSHAYGDWNSEPPDDPEAWGIAVMPVR